MFNVEQTLFQYAKNRGYLKVEENSEESKFRKNISENFMLTGNSVDVAEKSASEFLTLDPGVVDPSHAIPVFCDFSTFVTESQNPDLEKLLFPAYLHLLVDLKEMGFDKELEGLLERYRSSFPSEKEQNLISEVLDSAETDTPVSDEFRYRKIPKIPLLFQDFNTVHEYLLQIVSKGRAASLLQRIVRKSALVRKDQSPSLEVPVASGSPPVALKSRTETSLPTGDKDPFLLRLRETLQPLFSDGSVDRKDKNFPSVRVYNVAGSSSHVICSAVSRPSAGYLVSGLENSELMLCRLRSDAVLPEKQNDVHRLDISVGRKSNLTKLWT